MQTFEITSHLLLYAMPRKIARSRCRMCV